MKVAVIGGIALAIGLASGTGIGMRGGSAPPLPDSAAVHAGSKDSLKSSVTPPVVSHPAEPTLAAGPDSTVVDAKPPAASVSDTAFDPKPLADVLTKLSVAETVPLLSHFSDNELMAAFKLMGLSRASALVARLPEVRRGKLGRRVLLDLSGGGAQ